MSQRKEKLRQWQDKLARYDAAFAEELVQMDEREAIYRGRNRIDALVDGDLVRQTPHVRNIAAELIEAQVDPNIPQPKVTALRAQDEGLAALIEDMLRDKLESLDMELINDQLERTVPIQGGGLMVLEWDGSYDGAGSLGRSVVSVLHPKQICPQPGITGDIQQMEDFILKLPQTRQFIRRRYGIDLPEETEREPDVRGTGKETAAEGLVTQYVAYYRNDRGGIGMFSWVGDTVLEDLEDCQGRVLYRCDDCGAIVPPAAVAVENPMEDEEWETVCPYCGGPVSRQVGSFVTVPPSQLWAAVSV